MKTERDTLAETHSFIWNQVTFLLAVEAGGSSLLFLNITVWLPVTRLTRKQIDTGDSSFSSAV
jgi:hypothetical protein